MNDESIIQADDIVTSSNQINKLNILPKEGQPLWESAADDDSPFVEITFSETNDEQLDTVQLIDDENISYVLVEVFDRNGNELPSNQLVDYRGNEQPATGYRPDELPAKFGESVKGVKVKLTFVFTDDTKPVKTKVQIRACVEPGKKKFFKIHYI